MTPILWTAAALAAGIAALALAMRIALGGRPPLDLAPGERLPSTPLERMARWSIALGLLPSLLAAGLVLRFGPTASYDDDRVRLAVLLLMLGAVLAFAAFSIQAGRWAAREDGSLDERDRAILGRAPTAQSVAVLVTLAVWTIGLHETFIDTRLVPTVYLQLMFWSCVVVNLLALPVGVLFGYRRD